MRRLLRLAAAGAVVAVSVLAPSATRAEPHRKPPRAGANAYLPAGAKPAADNWLWPGGDEANSGFSQLKQIDSSNASDLKVAWSESFGLASDVGVPQSQPICCPSGLMLLTLRSGVVAIDPSDGHVVWRHQGPTFNMIRPGSAPVASARSEAYSPKWNLVYSGQQDGSIVALNVRTGAVVWSAPVSAAGTYGAATVAESEPFTQYYDDGRDGIVLTAPNGGESPIRGHLDAYDAKTGDLLWRVWTTPGAAQLPYILSWSNPAEAATGGAAVWSIPAVDPQLGLVFFGTGNIYPWTGRQPGNDLWGSSIMAVDWRTGALRWYFQEVRHDIWNLDSPNPPTRVNVPIDGKMVPLVAVGGKDGYLYVRAARNGRPVPHFGFKTIQTYDPTGKGIALNGLSRTQLVPTGAAACIWPVDFSAAGLTQCGWPPDLLKQEYGGPNNANVRPDGSLVNVADGEPIVGTPFASAHTSDAYFVFGGGATGGVMGYPRKAYNPITHDLYICAQGQSAGHSNMGNTSNAETINPSYSNVPGTPQATFSAVDMTRNQMAWQLRFDATLYGNCYSGALTTAGNLAITATTGPSSQALQNTQHFPGGTSALDLSGFFLVFDATTGKLLYRWQIPIPPEASGNAASFGSPPITYRYRGKQYIAIYHGLPAGSSYGDRLTVFSL